MKANQQFKITARKTLKFPRMIITNCTKFLAFIISIIFLTSCDPTRKINKNYQYFQNDRDLVVKTRIEALTIKPKDLLSIQVYSNSLNQEQAAIFNVAAQQGYLVDYTGKIEIPIIGQVVAGGLTRDEL